MNASSTSKLNGAVQQPEDAKIRRTRTAKATPHQAEEIHAPQDEAAARRQSTFERFMNAQQEMLREWGAPSAKRAMVAFACGLVVAFGVGFLGGLLIEALTVAVLTLTGSLLMSLMFWAIGVILTVWGGSVLAAQTYGYIASKTIDRHVDIASAKLVAAKNSVLGWFERKPVNAAVH